MKYSALYLFLLSISLNGAQTPRYPEIFLDSDDTYADSENFDEEDPELKELLEGVEYLGVVTPKSNTPTHSNRPVTKLVTALENKKDGDSSTQNSSEQTNRSNKNSHCTPAPLRGPSPSEETDLSIEQPMVDKENCSSSSTSHLGRCSSILERCSSTLSAIAGRCSSSVLSPTDRLLSPAIPELENLTCDFGPYGQKQNNVVYKHFSHKNRQQPYGRTPSTLKNNPGLNPQLKKLEEQCNRIS